MPLKIVLIGDSYTAGNGAGHYSGPQGCYRSQENWGQLYANSLEGFAVTLVNRACSGAEAKNVLEPRLMETKSPFIGASLSGRWAVGDPALEDELRRRCPDARYPDEESWNAVARDATYHALIDTTVVRYDCERWLVRQIEGVGTDTDLVLLTLGGNDVGFKDIVIQCFILASEDGCRTRIDAAEDSLPDLENALAEVLKAITSRIRADARIVLVSYPYLELGELRVGDYAAGQEVRRVGRLGDEMARAAVDRVNADRAQPPVYFVDAVKEAFAGREPDGGRVFTNPDRWLNEEDTLQIAEWYHPNPRGHRAIADLLAEEGTFGVGGRTRLGSLDLVLAIDATGSMSDDIAAVKAFSTDLIRQLSAGTQSYRFALVTYRDHPSGGGDPGDYPSRVDLDFSEDELDALGAVDSLSVAGGGDTPESVYSGLMEAIALKWRPGVKKVVIQMGDAPPHDPEPITGYGREDVVEAAIAVDPAVVNVLDVSSGGAANAALRDIASRTEGTVFDGVSAGEVAAALETLVGGALDAPYAWAAGPYVARTGAAVDFDASGSFDTSGGIVAYEWDFDGDGRFDVTESTPRISRAFEDEFDGLATLRVTDGDGNTSIATTRLTISTDGDEVAGPDDNCPDAANHGQDDFDGDGIGDECDPAPGYMLDPGGPTSQGEPLYDLGSVAVLLGLAAVAIGGAGGLGIATYRRPAASPSPGPAPERAAADGDAVYALASGSFVLGRSPQAQITLTDPQVSTMHARVDVADQRVTLIDLSSRNGTFVNGRQAQRAYLQPGDVIRVGETDLRLESSARGLSLRRLA